MPPASAADHELAAAVEDALSQRGALFFDQIAEKVGGFRNDVLDALWLGVWAGLVTNDTLAPLRSRRRPKHRSRPGRTTRRGRFRSRRTVTLPGSEGRWSLLPTPRTGRRRHESADRRRDAIGRTLRHCDA